MNLTTCAYDSCPICGLRLDSRDLDGQKAHMDAEHPEEVARRLTAAGFRFVDGEWVDLLASDA